MEIKETSIFARSHRAATGRLDDDLTGGDWQELSWLVDDDCPTLRQLAEKATTLTVTPAGGVERTQQIQQLSYDELGPSF